MFFRALRYAFFLTTIKRAGSFLSKGLPIQKHAPPSFTIPAPLYLKQKNKKSPLDHFFDFAESTAASLSDYILMAPKYNLPPGFRKVRIQFIAALGDPSSSSSSTGAKNWGLWKVDPGPRGVMIDRFNSVFSSNMVAPAGWKLDINDWWLDENGLIMESPQFPLPAGRYFVTGGRRTTAILTVEEGGGWNLDGGVLGAKLYDVTHLPCRSARYRPNEENGTPADARMEDFPVIPGAEMPSVKGCDKQDYSVLFVIGLDENM